MATEEQRLATWALPFHFAVERVLKGVDGYLARPVPFLC